MLRPPLLRDVNAQAGKGGARRAHDVPCRSGGLLACQIAAARPLQAQAPAAKPEMMESCPGLVASRGPRVIPAAFKLAALKGDQVRLTYVGHSTFLIESPAAGAHRHRLQRLRQAGDPARRGDDEPCAFDALHRPSGARHQARAARLGGGVRRAGALRRQYRGRARAQRADQYPRPGAAAPNATATRSSSSRWPTCASPISATCTTR